MGTGREGPGPVGAETLTSLVCHQFRAHKCSRVLGLPHLPKPPKSGGHVVACKGPFNRGVCPDHSMAPTLPSSAPPGAFQCDRVGKLQLSEKGRVWCRIWEPPSGRRSWVRRGCH